MIAMYNGQSGTQSYRDLNQLRPYNSSQQQEAETCSTGKDSNKGCQNRYEEGYVSLQHNRRYNKYTTHILIRSFLHPLRVRV